MAGVPTKQLPNTRTGRYGYTKLLGEVRMRSFSDRNETPTAKAA